MHRAIAEIWVAAAVMLAAHSGLAQGALFSADDPRYGANTLTVDKRTGLAWLDLPLTSGLAYDYVRAHMQPGGKFDGFRFASVTEVRQLFANAGLPGPGWYALSDPRTKVVPAFISMLGATTGEDGYPETFAISGDAIGGAHYGGGVDFFYSGGIPGYSANASFAAWGDAFPTDGVGSWLVMPVPEPSSWSLGILAALALIVRANTLRHRAPIPR